MAQKRLGFSARSEGSMLFGDAAREYMEEKSRRLRASTIEGYASALRRHVLPRWAGCEVEEVDPDELQRWVDGFELAGAAEKAFKTLRQVVRWYMRRHRVRVYDPTVGIELPRKAPYRPAVMDARGVRSYLRALWGSECEAVAICSVALGLRRGEACGLRWEDVNLSTGEVRVRRSRQVVGGEVVEVAPKTERSARSCYLPRFAVRRLRQLRGRARSGLLCDDRPDAIARRIRSACRRAGSAWCSMTCCRHTWATLAVEAGVGIETVAMMLGHTEIGTAYAHYIVPRRSICRDAQRAVEKLVMAA